MNPNQNARLLLIPVSAAPEHVSTIARQIATNGTELNTQDMSFLQNLRYPSPRVRNLLTCFFRTCFLASLTGTGAGCTIQYLGASVSLPETMKLIFTFPAILGWVVGLIFSTPPLLHYSCFVKEVISPEEEVTPPVAALGVVVGYYAQHNLFQRDDNHTRQSNLESAEDTRTRSTSSYTPPQLPEMI